MQQRTRAHLLAAVMTALAMTLSVASTAAAEGEQEPPAESAFDSSDQELPMEPRKIASDPVDISKTAADCQAEAARARAARIAESSDCVSIDEVPASETELPAKQAAQIQAVSREECEMTAPANTGWYATSRRAACAHQQFGITVTRVPSGVITGTANMHAIIDMTAATTSAKWSSNIYLWVWGSTGNGFPETANGTLVGCDACSGTSPGTGRLARDAFDSWRGYGSFAKTLPQKAVENGLNGRWSLAINSSKWNNGVAVGAPLALYRCDNNIPNRPAGCVFGTVPAAYGFSTAAVPEFARHVLNAQDSGLPGGYGSGTYLNRLTDKTLIRRNGTKACPSSLIRPTGRECDEYPFRSTMQGAYTGGTNVVRTQPWCGLNDPARTGSKGWSRCFILREDNRRAGGLLGGFYSAQRMLDGDPFQVGFLL